MGWRIVLSSVLVFPGVSELLFGELCMCGGVRGVIHQILSSLAGQVQGVEDRAGRAGEQVVCAQRSVGGAPRTSFWRP